MCWNLTWDEDYRPADDDKIIFPPSVVEAHRSGLEENKCCCPWLIQSERCKLTGETHKQTGRTTRIPCQLDGSLLGKSPRRRDTSLCHKTYYLMVSLHSQRIDNINSPLESQVKVDEQNAKGISNPVGGADILRSHSSETRCGNDNTDKASNVHSSTRVDSVMEPSTQRIIDQT
jgi:hypothetical protein